MVLGEDIRKEKVLRSRREDQSFLLQDAGEMRAPEKDQSHWGGTAHLMPACATAVPWLGGCPCTKHPSGRIYLACLKRYDFSNFKKKQPTQQACIFWH